MAGDYPPPRSTTTRPADASSRMSTTTASVSLQRDRLGRRGTLGRRHRRELALRALSEDPVRHDAGDAHAVPPPQRRGEPDQPGLRGSVLGRLVLLGPEAG